MNAKKFHYSLTIRERHLDTFGHVNNAEYLKILEEARWELITTNGYGLSDIILSGKGPIILDVHLKFKKELRLREVVTIETQCLEYRKKIGRLKQVMMNGAGEICAEAEFTFGLFDTVARKLIAPTPIWLSAIGIESTV